MLELITSDLHFGNVQNSQKFCDAQCDALNRMGDYARGRGIKKIRINGDLNHHKETLHTYIQNRMMGLFGEDLADLEFEILLGNHDILFRDSLKYHSLKFLEAFPNVNIVDAPKVELVEGLRVATIPWIVNLDDFWAWVAEATEHGSKPIDIAHGHFELRGFALNAYSKQKHGLNPDSFSSFFKKIFTGHFHTGSESEIGGCKIVYGGAPFQFTRIDAPDQKRFIVQDYSTNTHEFVDSIGIPKFVAVKFEEAETLTRESVEGNFVDVLVHVDDMGTKAFDEFVNRVRDFNPLRDEVKSYRNPEDLKIYEDDEEVEGDSKSPIELLLDYVRKTANAEGWAEEDPEFEDDLRKEALRLWEMVELSQNAEKL